MKNQLLLISTLMFAGTTSAMANIDFKYSDSDYTEAQYAWQRTLKGTNGSTEVSNYYWNGCSVDLNTNARYELRFNIQSNINGDSQPIFNAYLATSGISLLYGNYYGMGQNYQQGAAGVGKYGEDVSHGDLITSGSSTYIMNRWVDTPNGGLVAWKEASLTNTPCPGTSLANGFHTYAIIIEAFEDPNQADLIKFKYTGANQTKSDGHWTPDIDLNKTLGIASNSVLNVGWFVEADGGTISVDQATFQKETRTLKAPTEPEPDPTPDQPSTPTPPDVPEPSAFGLLAGLGAIALAASRRRRK